MKLGLNVVVLSATADCHQLLTWLGTGQKDRSGEKNPLPPGLPLNLCGSDWVYLLCVGR